MFALKILADLRVFVLRVQSPANESAAIFPLKESVHRVLIGRAFRACRTSSRCAEISTDNRNVEKSSVRSSTYTQASQTTSRHGSQGREEARQEGGQDRQDRQQEEVQGQGRVLQDLHLQGPEAGEAAGAAVLLLVPGALATCCDAAFKQRQTLVQAAQCFGACSIAEQPGC